MALNIAVPLSGVGGLSPISPIGIDCWENIKMLVSPIGSESSGVSSLDSEEAKLQLILQPSPPPPVMPPKIFKINYKGRNILDLAANIQTNSKYWNLRYTYLPENNNIPMFLANRSQYHRLGANGHIQEYSLVRCEHCDFQYPINGGGYFCQTSVTVSPTTQATMTYTGQMQKQQMLQQHHQQPQQQQPPPQLQHHNHSNNNFNVLHNNNNNNNNHISNSFLKKTTAPIGIASSSTNSLNSAAAASSTSPTSTSSGYSSSSSIGGGSFGNGGSTSSGFGGISKYQQQSQNLNSNHTNNNNNNNTKPVSTSAFNNFCSFLNAFNTNNTNNNNNNNLSNGYVNQTQTNNANQQPTYTRMYNYF